MAIYDAFLFYNEVELLKLRMDILAPHVDFFVISECDYTFSGNKKTFNFENSVENFSEYKEKLIYVKHINSNLVNSEKITQNFAGGRNADQVSLIINYFNKMKESWDEMPHWSRDYLHREYVRLGLKDCKDSDIIIFGDVDEIPSPEVISALTKGSILELDDILCCKQDMYYYNFNLKTKLSWNGSRISRWESIKNKSLNALRTEVKSQIILEGAGWHFSFFGGINKVKSKIEDYSHQEFNNKKIISKIESNLIHGRDLFNRDIGLKWVPIGESHPKLIQDNLDKYSDYIIEKPEISFLYQINYLAVDCLRLIKKNLKLILGI
jgi:beta-1,4-mannosyl-glycoprotein beta-1,4-N-acetylglucosaminyltransferase